MAEAFVYDAIRTPRGKGKSDGSLHEVKPITLLSGVLRELQARHDFDTAEVEDVVMGCVSPVGEQGSCIAKTAALAAGLPDFDPAFGNCCDAQRVGINQS